MWSLLGVVVAGQGGGGPTWASVDPDKDDGIAISFNNHLLMSYQ